MANLARPHAGLLLVLALTLAAGCLAPPADPGVAAPAEPIVPGFAQDHDHLDATLHDFAAGMERVSYHNLAPGTDGARAADRGAWANSEVIVRGDHAYVGYLGAPWLFAIVDIADAENPVLVSAFEASNAWTMDITVSDDGDWVFASVYNAQSIGAILAPTSVLRAPDPPSGLAAPGVLVVDARDRANPVATGFLPIPGLGPHTAVYHRYPDGREVVFANRADPTEGDAVVLAEVVDAPSGRTLEPVGTFAIVSGEPRLLPHDVDVQEHPITGRTLLTVAYFNAGLVIVDVTDPAAPALVSRFTDYSDSDGLNLHDAHPLPSLAGGRHYTFTAPEHATNANTGYLRVYDTTDPAAPALVGAWTLPGDFVVAQGFDFSPHNFQFLPDGRVALAHGHAGVWIVDWLGPGGLARPDPAFMAEPRSVAYGVPYAPGAAPPPWTPVHGTPWAWGTAVDARGLVWVSDVASGLHALRVTA